MDETVVHRGYRDGSAGRRSDWLEGVDAERRKNRIGRHLHSLTHGLGLFVLLIVSMAAALTMGIVVPAAHDAGAQVAAFNAKHKTRYPSGTIITDIGSRHDLELRSTLEQCMMSNWDVVDAVKRLKPGTTAKRYGYERTPGGGVHWHKPK